MANQAAADVSPNAALGGGYPVQGSDPTLGGGYPAQGLSPALGGGYPDQGPGPALGGGYPAQGSSPALGGGYPDQGPGAALGGGYPDQGPGPALGGGYPAQGSSPALGGYPDQGPGAALGGGYPAQGPGPAFGGGYPVQEPAGAGSPGSPAGSTGAPADAYPGAQDPMPPVPGSFEGSPGATQPPAALCAERRDLNMPHTPLDDEKDLVSGTPTPVTLVGTVHKEIRTFVVKEGGDKKISYSVYDTVHGGIDYEAKHNQSGTSNKVSSMTKVKSKHGEFKISGKMMTMHGRQEVYMGSRVVLTVSADAMVGKKTKFMIKDEVKGADVAEIGTEDGRDFVTFKDLEGRLLAVAARPTTPIIKTDTGSELQLAVAPGIDCSVVILSLLAMFQVGANTAKSWFHNHVTANLKKQNKYKAESAASKTTNRATTKVWNKVTKTVNKGVDSVLGAVHLD